MALIKDKTLASGAVGNYWRITSASINQVTRRITCKLELFKDDTFKNKPSLQYSINFSIDATAAVYATNIVQYCYDAIKAKNHPDLTGAIDG